LYLTFNLQNFSRVNGKFRIVCLPMPAKEHRRTEHFGY
jgi:hypothetical protein